MNVTKPILRADFTIEEIFNLKKIDRWFLMQLKEIVGIEEDLAGIGGYRATSLILTESVVAN